MSKEAWVVFRALKSLQEELVGVDSKLTVRTALEERPKKIRVGPASDPRSEMGPLINKPNVARADKMVEDVQAI